MYKIIDGNNACANIAYKFSELSFIYPITPSSPMASAIEELKNKQELNFYNKITDVIEMQSEAGAAGALHGASGRFRHCGLCFCRRLLSAQP